MSDTESAQVRVPSWHKGTIRSANQIEFVQEPPKSKRDPFYGVMNALTSHKDRWAIIAENYKSSDLPKLRELYPEFEIVSRSDKDGIKQSDPGWTIYACYRGTEWFLARQREARERRAAKRAGKQEDDGE